VKCSLFTHQSVLKSVSVFRFYVIQVDLTLKLSKANFNGEQANKIVTFTNGHMEYILKYELFKH